MGLSVVGLACGLGWIFVPANAGLGLGALGGVGSYYYLLHRFHRRNDERSFWRVLIEDALLLLVVPALAVAVIGHALTGDPLKGRSAIERGQALLDAGEALSAEAELKRHLQQHPADVEAHRLRLRAHFQIPLVIGKNQQRDDGTIRKEYERWAHEHAAELAPIGPLSLGIYYRSLRDPKRALQELAKVRDPHFSGLQFERALCLEELGEYRQALIAFMAAAKTDEHKAPAIRGLARNLVSLRDFDELRRLFSGVTQAGEYAPDAHRKLLVHDGRWGRYLFELVAPPRLGFVQYLLAGLTFLLWFAAIRFWDRFESEPLWIALGTTALGGGISQLVFVVNDLRAQFFAAGLGRGWWSDLVYCVVGIGLVEEVTKLLPVALVRRFTKHIDEPADWAIYGAYSALGFAIWENVLYHRGLGSGTVAPRAMLTVPVHLCLTAMTGLLFFEARRLGFGRLLAIGVALSFGAVTHGLYDFFIVGPWEILGVLSVGVAMWLFFTFNRSLVQALAQSPFRKLARAEHHQGGAWFLRGFFLLLMVIFAIRISEIGAQYAWGQMLLLTVLNGLGLAMLFVLGNLDIPHHPTAIAPQFVLDFLRRHGWIKTNLSGVD